LAKLTVHISQSSVNLQCVHRNIPFVFLHKLLLKQETQLSLTACAQHNITRHRIAVFPVEYDNKITAYI